MIEGQDLVLSTSVDVVVSPPKSNKNQKIKIK